MDDGDIPLSRWLALVWALMYVSLLPVLAGWLAGNGDWVTWLSKYGVMRFNTALGFFFLLMVFAAFYFEKPLLGQLVVILLVALAGLSLSQDLLKIDLKIDELFVNDFLPMEREKYPGRMSPATATAFLICGLSCIPLMFKRYYLRRVCNVFLTLVLAEGLLAVMSALGIPKSEAFAFSGGLSTHTGIMFFICSAFILHANNWGSKARFLITWVPIAGFALMLYLSINIWITFKYNFFETFYGSNNVLVITRQVVETVGADIAQGVMVVGVLYAFLTAFCLHLYFKARLNSEALVESESRSQAD